MPRGVVTPTAPLAERRSDHPQPGGEARLRAMVDQHLDAVWRTLKRLGVPVGTLDDAVQEVFIVGSRRLDEIEGGRERSYLLGVAWRVASDARRALRRRREVPLEEAAAAELAIPRGPEERLDAARAKAALAAALTEMSEEMRDAFVLFELEELGAPEVANLLGVPVGTVASRVRRARELIRRRLGGEAETA